AALSRYRAAREKRIFGAGVRVSGVGRICDDRSRRPGGSGRARCAGARDANGVQARGLFGRADLSRAARRAVARAVIETGRLVLFPAHWGCGYGYEAATALLDWGWATTRAARICAITSAINTPSRGLMTRLGMVQLPGGEFVSPRFDPGDVRAQSLTYAVERR